MARTYYFREIAHSDPDQHRAICTMGAYIAAARREPGSLTAHMRTLKRAKAVASVDPEGNLSPEALEARLVLLRKAESIKMLAARRAKKRRAAAQAEG